MCIRDRVKGEPSTVVVDCCADEADESAAEPEPEESRPQMNQAPTPRTMARTTRMARRAPIAALKRPLPFAGVAVGPCCGRPEAGLGGGGVGWPPGCAGAPPNAGREFAPPGRAPNGGWLPAPPNCAPPPTPDDGPGEPNPEEGEPNPDGLPRLFEEEPDGPEGNVMRERTPFRK